MRSLKLIAPLAVTCLMACTDLEVTNPNQRTTDTFWLTDDDAIVAINAAYGGIQGNGVYGRWLHFASDARTDVGTSRSPWTDLQNWTRTVLVSSNFEGNEFSWRERYHAIYRANQVIENVPAIEMDEGLKRRIVAEATFLRGLMYYDLAILFGNVPVITEVLEAGEFPATQPEATVLAQAETDALAAAADLPESYTGNDVGRATRGAALALAARAQLQQREWPTAAATFRQVVESGVYDLAPTYAENFTMQGENNMESVFEAQFGGPGVLASGTRGLNIAKLVGPPEIGFTDVQPTEWFFQQYFAESGTADPRLDATIFWNKPGGMDVHGRPFAQRYPNGFKDTGIDKTYFWKKYGEHWLPVQDWDAALNYKVIRYADVLLMLAEALTEAGEPDDAATYLNMVRTRVGLPEVSTTLGQADMRARIEHEMLMELGWENKRLPYLKRHDLFKKAVLQPHDPDFDFFVDGKSELLPVPQNEVDLNPNVTQNPGW